MALTSTTSSGGKSSGPTRARLFVEPGEALLKEALPPPANDFPTGIQPLGDFVITKALGSEQDHLGTDDLKVR
jgi:hypothetical protein